MRIDEKFIKVIAAEIRGVVGDCLNSTSISSMADELMSVAVSGKMLRVRMMFRVGMVNAVPVDNLKKFGAAVEMLHAASLLHDDVIDGAVLRRGAPSFWIAKGASGAILLGDLLVCQAYKMVDSIESGKHTPSLINFASEVCEAEVEQELLLKGEAPDWKTCVSIARRKTGALFAFAARASGGDKPGLCNALTEAGYAVGTAYQLADDILDAYGNQDLAGKTLGSDAISSKITAATSWHKAGVDPRSYIMDLLSGSQRMLAAWPEVQAAWGDYLREDLEPVIGSFLKTFVLQES